MMSLDLSVQGGVHDSLLWQMEFFVPTPHFPPLESDRTSHLHHFVCIIVGRACVRACMRGWVAACLRAWVGACVRSCVRACVHILGTGFDSVAQGILGLQAIGIIDVDIYHHA